MTRTETEFRPSLAALSLKPDERHPEWLGAVRRAAADWVASHGFPTTKDEDWRYTAVAPVLGIPFVLGAEESPSLVSAEELDERAGHFGGLRLVFLNGHFAAELSSLDERSEGIDVGTIGQGLLDNAPLATMFEDFARRSHDAFGALNTALTEDGAFLQIRAGTIVERPIHLVFVSHAGESATVSNPRSILLFGRGSKARIVESYLGLVGEPYLTNSVVQLVLDEDADVEYYKVQNEQDSAFHLALLDARLAPRSRLVAHSFAFGSSIARHEVRVELAGEGAEAILNGLFMPNGEQLHDNPTLIERTVPNCTSQELYKGVVDGHGYGVFNGRIVVRPGADGTDARQTNKNLLLSEWAEVDTRPRLEILADDVKCAHGAAVGQLDEDAVFYLRARGLSEDRARGLLTYAFVNEMLALVSVEAVRAYLENLVAQRLPSPEQQSRAPHRPDEVE